MSDYVEGFWDGYEARVAEDKARLVDGIRFITGNLAEDSRGD